MRLFYTDDASKVAKVARLLNCTRVLDAKDLFIGRNPDQNLDLLQKFVSEVKNAPDHQMWLLYFVFSEEEMRELDKTAGLGEGYYESRFHLNVRNLRNTPKVEVYADVVVYWLRQWHSCSKNNGGFIHDVEERLVATFDGHRPDPQAHVKYTSPEPPEPFDFNKFFGNIFTGHSGYVVSFALGMLLGSVLF